MDRRTFFQGLGEIASAADSQASRHTYEHVNLLSVDIQQYVHILAYTVASYEIIRPFVSFRRGSSYKHTHPASNRFFVDGSSHERIRPVVRLFMC